ncbi:MAG: FAD-dependent oxidoreductase [archaeon]
MKKDFYDVAIIGRGIAGLSAAMYCRRLNLNVIVIGDKPGGTLINASLVENYPGFNKISGIGLMKKILNHTQEYTPKILEGNVEEISKIKEGFRIKTKKQRIDSKTIIFCTGSELRKLGIPGEEKFAGKGVHYCALCDGFFYKNKEIAIVGGGDSSVKEALLLSKYAKKVYLISRSNLKPEPINLAKLKLEKKIEIIEKTSIREIKGNKSVETIDLGKRKLNVEGVFVEIGRVPLSFLATQIDVKLNKNKEIIIDKESQTNIPGVYSAGDVTDTKIKQSITGVGDAVKAAYSAYRYIQDKTLDY